MENLDNSTLLFEILVRIFSANLKMQSLIIKASQSQEIQNESKEIIDQLIQWINTVQNFSGIEKNLKGLILILANTLENITTIENKSKIPEKISNSRSSVKEETIEIKGNYDYINDLVEDSLNHESIDKTSPIDNKISESVLDDTILKTPDKQPLISSEDSNNNNTLMERTSKTLGFLDRLSEIGTKADQPIEDILVSQEGQQKLFHRILKPADEWGYIEHLSTLLRNYSNIMHLALPNFLFSIVEELHRYRSDNMELMEQIVAIPSAAMNNLVSKFLKEAPSASLLRRLRANRRMAQIDIEDDVNINEEDKIQIKSYVEQYYETMKKYLEMNNPLAVNSYYDKLTQSLINFSLGPVEIETRIIQIIKANINDLLTKAKPIPNKPNSLVTETALLATAEIIFDMTDYWLEEGSRIRQFLEEMKEMKI